MNAREMVTFFQLNVCEGGRHRLEVQPLTPYSPGYAVTALVSLLWSALFDKPVK